MKSRTRFLVPSLLALAAGSSVLACETTVDMVRPRPLQRAMWVTRFDYRTRDDVLQIVRDCKSAGINTILFQVRGNATAFYRSSYEPWAEQLGGRDPGFDPLATAIEAAHQSGLR